MEALRKKLHKAIEEYGISDKRTIYISEELDKEIYRVQNLKLEKFLKKINT